MNKEAKYVLGILLIGIFLAVILSKIEKDLIVFMCGMFFLWGLIEITDYVQGEYFGKLSGPEIKKGSDITEHPSLSKTKEMLSKGKDE